jgi:acyl-CoA synthetase (AMP-forming)/AMP-acid ligase II
VELNLADLFECVVDHVGERDALVCGSRRHSYRSLDEAANRAAHALARAGVRPGDHVALYLANSVEHVEVMLACYKLRAVPVNVSFRYVADELAYLCRDSGAVALCFDEALAAEVGAVSLDDLPELLVEVPGVYEQLVGGEAADRSGFPVRSADDHYVLYTGGTTGRPKGVVWRHEDIFFATMGGGNPGGPPITRAEEIGPNAIVNRAQRAAPFLPPDHPGPERFVSLALGPLIHASGQWSAIGTLLGGGTAVLYDRAHMDMEHVLSLVEREHVVALNLVGDASARPLLDTLAETPERFDTSSLLLVGSGGSILSADVKERLLETLPSVLAIVDGIGSSEVPAQAVAVTTRAGDRPRPLRFAPKAETMVVDDHLRPVAAGAGAVGRLATRGRLPIGYHNDPEKTAATFVEIDGVRWTLPGDMATVEADGSIRLLGRGSQCINTGGEKVYPEEVEAVVKAAPGVADAVVVGAPDPRWGETVVAVVQPRAGAEPTLEEIDRACRGHLAGYKVPRRLVVVDEVRRSPAGKPDYSWAREVASATEGAR